MFHSQKTLAFGITLALALFASRPAAADRTIPAAGSADGQILSQTDPTPQEPVGIQVYEVVGQGTLLGRHINRGMTFFTADGAVMGVFTITAADGATVSGSYEGAFAPIPGTSDFEFLVEVTWESGKDRLEGVSGGATVSAIVDGITGALHYDYEGDFILP